MQKLQWHTEKRRVKNLIPCDDNPNINDEQEFSKLKKSIQRNGYVEIIVIDTDDKIAAGNHRHRALMELGMADREIDVRVPNRKLTKEEFDRYLIASNALHGEWDIDVLREYDPELLLEVLNHNDLMSVFDDNLEIQDDELDEEAEIEKAKGTKIKLGDYFALGRHRLLCADALDPNSAKRLMGDVRADMVNDDIPFNIGLRYDRNFTGRKKFGGTTNDSKSDADYRAFVKTIMQNALSMTKPDAHILFWCDERWVWLLQELYRELGIDSKRLCIWLKDNASPTPQVAFNKITEFVVYGTIGRPHLNDRVRNLNEVINKEVGTGNRLTEDILDMLNIWLVKRLSGSTYDHPTQKPPTLYEKSLRRCTRPGDAVLDLTAGSGALLSACEQLKRTAYLVEIEPVFCQVIINRFKKISNENLKKLN